MSLRKLVEGDCGAANPLMQFGNHLTRDQGFFRPPFETSRNPEEQLVHEFIGQISGPPQSFQMNALLHEMREIEKQNFQPQVINAPRVIDEVTKTGSDVWRKEFEENSKAIEINSNKLLANPNSLVQYNEFWQQSNMPVQQKFTTKEFFDMNEAMEGGTSHYNTYSPPMQPYSPPMQPYSPSMQPYRGVYPYHMPPEVMYPQNDMYYARNNNNMMNFPPTEQRTKTNQPATLENWLDDYQKSKEENEKQATDYNEKFWQRLQNEWQKMSEGENGEHPWLSDYSDLNDAYKEYKFSEDNPMSEIENAFEKGKEFLAKGDIPSAVLCFEAAVQKESNNAEIWELLGLSQAENEMDPQSIAALKKSLELNPDNMRVLMSLAVSYTNESLQNQALKMLVTWLHCNPKYKNLVPEHILKQYNNEELNLANSLFRGPKLKEIQNIFLQAVQQNRTEVDPNVQEALGVLFNLSSEFDKAVDCFHAALQVQPNNAKIWNRLGASLANGSRSVEAVEAYQRALEIEPGFIRVRYNVGVCCMNLKAYKQAAEHLLIALNLQANSVTRSGLPNMVTNSSQQMSESIWSTLKMIISLMGRSDLHEHVNQRNLDALNEAFKE